jgi:hypothetical protein
MFMAASTVFVVRGISAREEEEEEGDKGSGISIGKFSLVF